MTYPTVEEHFDWVIARDRCSIEQAFADLRLIVQRVTASRNRLGGSDPEQFLFSEDGGAFSVTRKADAAAVTFRLDGRYVRISGHGIDSCRAVQTRLDDDGQCVLVVRGALVRRWRITYDALDALFFDEGTDRPR